MEQRWSYPYSLFFHIVASISVEWKRVVKRFLINWMQWEIYRVVFGAIPLIVSHKMHYLVLWLRTIGANWNNKKAFTLRTCHINSSHEGFCAILSPILNAPEPLLQHSTRILQAHLGLLLLTLNSVMLRLWGVPVLVNYNLYFLFYWVTHFFVPFFSKVTSTF